jgi:hypothetical protein
MKILEQALSKIKSINKKQRDFFATLVQGLIGITGKRTFRNLSRYFTMHEKTFSRQMSKVFDFLGLNTELIRSAKSDGDVLIAAQDATYVPKSGKETHGLGWVWSGTAGRVEKGLEVDAIAVIKVNDKKASYTLSCEQLPATKKSEKKEKKSKSKKSKKKKSTKTTKTGEPNKMDAFIAHFKKAVSKLIELGIKYIAVDAFFAKYRYVEAVLASGLHVISKLRIDARIKRPFTGQQKKRGRKKMYETGGISEEDFKGSECITIAPENIILRSYTAYSVSLKRKIKIVWVYKDLGNGKYGEAYLFSTDLELDTLKIYEFYTSRFQIEFIFRDAKNFTGFTDCQSRDAQRLHYHFNASLVALNVAKIQDLELQKMTASQLPFSMSNWNRKYLIDLIINRFIVMLGLDQTCIKSHPNFEKLLSLGKIYHD